MTAPWKSNFPDFDDMPEIPAGWEDVSWHNDACPSFLTGAEDGLQIFVNYKDPALREVQDAGPRFFAVSLADDSQSVLFETDDWQEMLAFIADRPRVKV